MKRTQYSSMLAAALMPALLLVSSCDKEEVPAEKMVPAITSISSLEAPKDALITVTGKHFLLLDTPEVIINNKSLSITRFTDDTLVVKIPKMLGSGKVILKVGEELYEGPVFNYQYTATVSTVAGNGTVGSADGAGNEASFNNPWGITAAPNGDLFIADSYNRLIRKVKAGSHEVETIQLPVWFAGSEFYSPYNIALDHKTGDLFVTDFNQHVLKITAAGDKTVIYTGPMATTGIVVGSDGFVYVSNNTQGKILKMSTDGKSVQEFTGGLRTPRNLILDKKNTMFVSAVDGNTPAIFRVDQTGTAVPVLKMPGFNGWEIAADTLGNFYAADYFNNTLRLIEPNGRMVTIAGNGTAADADGVGAGASFDGPKGITIDNDGNIYITTFNDTQKTGNKVRKIVVE
ncbi:MAG TPA: IPT/TIG domain-containing protein [Sphingobacteriaceae bacterium]